MTTSNPPDPTRQARTLPLPLLSANIPQVDADPSERSEHVQRACWDAEHHESQVLEISVPMGGNA
jgi:hypothetical protein